MTKKKGAAVLLITYRRFDTAQKVFEAIRIAKPVKLYFASNAARSDKPDESEKVETVRSLVKLVDWPCEVYTLFRTDHLSAKHSISSAIDWFFQHEEQGIILEDDCVPHPSFFRFCDELLKRYRDDQRVGMISGNNFQFGYRLNDDSYYFSNCSYIWGWASWRTRWQSDYDVEMKYWPTIRDEGRINDWFGSQMEQDFYADMFEKTYQGEIDTWDYQWNFCNRLKGRIAVMPNVNLVSNIGFGAEATHTKDVSALANMSLEEMIFPLKHPVGFFASVTLDGLSHRLSRKQNIFNRVKSKIARIIGRITGR
jgi:hypothetical protein